MKIFKNFIPLWLLVIILFLVGTNFYIRDKSIKNNTSAPSVSGTSKDVESQSLMGTVPQTSYLYADYDFDGFKDRAELLDCGATGNCSYLIELYNPSTKSFPKTTADLTDIRIRTDDRNFIVTNPTVNVKEKIICSFSNSSASDYNYYIYKYSKNYFYPVKEITVELDMSIGKLARKTFTFERNEPKQQAISYISADTESSIPDCTLK
ncbi:MAG TPA: hypothetical protein VK675_02740 [Candidatus Paceibacterota bacterium]|nr:hypothetical protein [Candidatus Paceibacterota bacterium]